MPLLSSPPLPPVPGQTEPLLIAGQAFPGDGPVLDVVNPADGSLIGQVATASPALVRHSVDTATRALQASQWAARPPHDRARILTRAADEIERQADHLADLQMRENGKTRSESRGQALAAAGIFRYYAAVCECAEDALPPPRGAG